MLRQRDLNGMLAPTLAVIVGACSFSGGGNKAADAGPDAAIVEIDAAPALAGVHFVSVKLLETPTLRAGVYGVTVEAVLENELEEPITDVRVSLRFFDDDIDRGSFFRWRSFDRRDGTDRTQPTTIAPGETATFRFKLDVLPFFDLATPVEVDGVAAFLVENTAASAVGLEAPTLIPVLELNTIVVDTFLDNTGVDGTTSLRDAIETARGSFEPDRIVFDRTVFPPKSRTAINFDVGLGPFPLIDMAGGDLIIDGGDARVELAVDNTWDENLSYAFELDGPSLIISNVAFRNWAFNYPVVDLSSDNCGPAGTTQAEGGALLVNLGTLILDGNRFADPDVPERDCYATTVRLYGGDGHRIINNEFTDQATDSIVVSAPTFEISHNIFDAVGNVSNSDDAVLFAAGLDDTFWVVGNVFIDLETSGVLLTQVPDATVYIVHNTFVRMAQSAIFRLSTDGGVILRNNLFVNNAPTALGFDGNNNGNGFDVDYDHLRGNARCGGCANLTVGPSNNSGPPGLMNIDGTTRADFIPVVGSSLIDSGIDWIDRNGRTPRRFNGTGPDRGAIEVP